MDLKDFVSQTLTQIVQGVKDAHGAVAKEGGIVNPAVDLTTSGNAETYGTTTKNLRALLVRFDVAVTVSDTTGMGGGGKLSVAGMFSVGGEAAQASSNETTSRIQFGVPIVLPIDPDSQRDRDERYAAQTKAVRGY